MSETQKRSWVQQTAGWTTFKHGYFNPQGYFADETSLPLEEPEGKMEGEEGITTIENVYSEDFNDGDDGGNDLNKVSARKAPQSHNQLPGYAHSERL